MVQRLPPAQRQPRRKKLEVPKNETAIAARPTPKAAQRSEGGSPTPNTRSVTLGVVRPVSLVGIVVVPAPTVPRVLFDFVRVR